MGSAGAFVARDSHHRPADDYWMSDAAKNPTPRGLSRSSIATSESSSPRPSRPPRRVAAPGPDVVYSGGTLPFRDGAFDTVLSVQVLEHTARPGALVAEMSRVLARDGLLILTAPFQFRLHEQPH